MLYSYLKKAVAKAHKGFMKERFDLFLHLIGIEEGGLIVDLGGGSGEFMEMLRTVRSDCEILVADISENALDQASRKGFDTVLLTELEPFPFESQEVDVVFCNSVIEHCTIAKSLIWTMTDSDRFRQEALRTQASVAEEIERVGRKYFVQTPTRSFPIESHTLFPFVATLSRPRQVAAIRLLNRFWFKKTSPDWNLLDRHQMASLFPSGKIIERRWLGFSKEIIAYRG